VVCLDACASHFDGRASVMGLPTDGFPDGKDVPGRKQVLLETASLGEVARSSRSARRAIMASRLDDESELHGRALKLSAKETRSVGTACPG
jgi:hypothetical protein